MTSQKTKEDELKEEAGFEKEALRIKRIIFHNADRADTEEDLIKSAIKTGIAEGRRLQKIEDDKIQTVYECSDIECMNKGYAKALADVEKIIDEMKWKENNSPHIRDSIYYKKIFRQLKSKLKEIK